jgi:tetratricopeptide (TPR) repeat protein
MADLVPLENRGERLELFEEAESYARKCIEEAPKKGECYFWLGAALGRESTMKGILSSALTAREIASSLEKSVELGLTYRSASGHIELANAYYALGQFYRIAPDSWIASKIAGVRGNIERSVNYLRKAIELEPERLEFNKELGISLVCLGQEKNRPETVQEGVTYLTRVANVLPVKEPSDEIDKRHARMLLNDPGLCCDYSRDGQQERDLKKADTR